MKSYRPNEYVVLRAPSARVPEFRNLGRAAAWGWTAGPTSAGALGPVSPATVQVETAELSKHDLRDLRRDSEVVSFAPVMPLKLHEPVARDVSFSAQSTNAWGIEAVGAHTSPFSGEGVTVAVLDTGIDAQHDAFKNVTIVEEDFTDEGNGDVDGHGTHCAGTIFGGDVGGTRIGVAPGIDRALIGKVLGQGGGSTQSIVEAVQWAVNSGAHVVSMSLGIDFPGMVEALVDRWGYPIDLATSKALEGYRANIQLFDALADWVAANGGMAQATLIVAASGNESQRAQDPDHEIAASPPSASGGILAVGALGQGNGGLEVASFSNTNVNVAAPGVGIVSARAGGGLVGMSGTSMATPHAAGVAALWASKILAQVGTLDPTTLTARFVASGQFQGLAPGFDPLDVGTGIVLAPQA